MFERKYFMPQRIAHRSLAYPVFLLTCLLCICVLSMRAQDAKGSSDHPLFPDRMPGYTISSHKTHEFSSYAFHTKPPTTVEGKHTFISYYLKDMKQHPGGLAIRRNYDNAIKAVGGKVIFSDDNYSVIRAKRDSVEVWAEIHASLANIGRYYRLNIIERTIMKQIITADAMATALETDGYVALDIHFATGKADILPESQPLIAEIVTLLKTHPDLRVGIEGHTDNVGKAKANKTLSKNRAVSVVQALVADGIAKSRLDPVGYGQEHPVADNRTDEGRALNRRVEIVKRKR